MADVAPVEAPAPAEAPAAPEADPAPTPEPTPAPASPMDSLTSTQQLVGVGILVLFFLFLFKCVLCKKKTTTADDSYGMMMGEDAPAEMEGGELESQEHENTP